MSNQANKRVRKAINMEVNRDKLPTYSSVGCYPLEYITSDGACLCADCVNDNVEQIDDSIKTKSNDGWRIVAVDVNYENNELYCDNCSKVIEASYC